MMFVCIIIFRKAFKKGKRKKKVIGMKNGKEIKFGRFQKATSVGFTVPHAIYVDNKKFNITYLGEIRNIS